jgi:hypothetical protein
MQLRIETYRPEDVEGVRELNRRLNEGGEPVRFPESPVPSWLPPRDGAPLWQELFVVRDQQAVRGGYILKPQPFWVDGEERLIADYQLPVSEGTVDSRFGLVGLMTVKDALRRHPLLFGLGMGGTEEAVAKLLRILKFRMVPCPFLFRVVRPVRFLRGIRFLRRRPARRLALDAAALSGLGWLGLKVLRRLRTRRLPGAREVRVGTVDRFGPWCDPIWDSAKEAYDLIAVRNEAVLRTLYPEHSPRFIRLRVSRGPDPIGWAVVLDTAMRDHKHFGDLRVGTLVDALALPGAEPEVVRAASRHLTGAGVDLIVTNQLARRWCAACRASGYLEGPSNFLFAASPKLAERLEPFDERAGRIHMTRGDGDGPVHL